MRSLEGLVAAHPGTTFIVAHVGCYPENLAWVDRMLTTYPNMVIDVSQRMAELGRQPRAAARLICKHRERVLFGTDSFPPTADVYRRWWRFLETRRRVLLVRPLGRDAAAGPLGRLGACAAGRGARPALPHERAASNASLLTLYLRTRVSFRRSRATGGAGVARCTIGV